MVSGLPTEKPRINVTVTVGLNQLVNEEADREGYSKSGLVEKILLEHYNADIVKVQFPETIFKELEAIAKSEFRSVEQQIIMAVSAWLENLEGDRA